MDRRALVASVVACAFGCSSPAPVETSIEAGADGPVAGPEPGEISIPSNTPRARFVVGQSAYPGLALLSSFFEFRALPNGEHSQRWRGEIENRSKDTICEPLVTATARHADGTVLAEAKAVLTTPKVYTCGGAGRSKVSYACLLPGEKSVYAADDWVPTQQRISDFARVDVAITDRGYTPCTPYPEPPALTHERFVDAQGREQVRWTVVVGSYGILRMFVNVFFFDAGGLLFAHDYGSKTSIAPGETWTGVTDRGPPGGVTRVEVAYIFGAQ